MKRLFKIVSGGIAAAAVAVAGAAAIADTGAAEYSDSGAGSDVALAQNTLAGHVVERASKVVAQQVATDAIAVAETDDADSNEPSDIPISGDALSRASQVALDHIGEGSVTETEIEDEESYYEVEVTRNDGSQVDVQLDESFNIVGTEDDGRGDND